MFGKIFDSKSVSISNDIETQINIGNSVLTGDSVVDNYRPRTELGRKLLALRKAYVISGGKLLDDNAFDAEIR